MKKTILKITMIALMVGLYSCSSNESTTVEETTAEEIMTEEEVVEVETITEEVSSGAE